MALLAVLFLSGCFRDRNHPGWAWFPDMAQSPAYETYTSGDSTLFPNGMSTLAPVEGTIPRGYIPFHYENTDADRLRAGQELVNPVPLTKNALDNGKYNFEIYCAICHGAGGKGDGYIVEGTKKFLAVPPSYFVDRLMVMPDGEMFFTMHYGKGQMGSYASQLSQHERWEIVHYINFLQDQAARAAGGTSGDAAATASSDTTATNQ